MAYYSRSSSFFLSSAFSTSYVEHLPGHHSTKYKKKGLEAGSVIHYFVWEMKKTPDDNLSEQNKVDKVPNVLLHGEIDFNQIFSAFEPLTWKTKHRKQPVLLQLIAPYRSLDRDNWLMEARVNESGFVQHILLSITQKKDGSILIKPSAIGAPRPTWGIKQLVAQLAHVENTGPRVASHHRGCLTRHFLGDNHKSPDPREDGIAWLGQARMARSKPVQPYGIVRHIRVVNGY